jgi:hypothetical protein
VLCSIHTNPLDWNLFNIRINVAGRRRGAKNEFLRRRYLVARVRFDATAIFIFRIHVNSRCRKATPISSGNGAKRRRTWNAYAPRYHCSSHPLLPNSILTMTCTFDSATTGTIISTPVAVLPRAILVCGGVICFTSSRFDSQIANSAKVSPLPTILFSKSPFLVGSGCRLLEAVAWPARLPRGQLSSSSRLKSSDGFLQEDSRS